ncbi:mitochondrial 37S ribosomal protein mS43 NDAI_0C04590 [Naumovozyma dairenensis CBS 421]|uniref:Manganese/iron superoxide dismutase C-terminal domain-containing protein n=1 Tax=Naumovozyma dairenensis (strain ATCC 10597 / BCRC 20456 / CBS 421 / NBRC 0211 / NRRL Y-12639) TaxID=1071378 RepID=G0W8K8_NAUDC|nr:hypothetical protein NDAI_0C04590 [Naumovozyma dairenensis CBS 421]CCD24119.1 hypothetical protein NDAI_0C04590 [Naumovozyma dairenensis CBS 421]
MLNNFTRSQGNTNDNNYLSLIQQFSNTVTKRDVVNYASLLYNLNFAFSSLKGCDRELPKILRGSESLLQIPDFSQDMDVAHSKNSNNILSQTNNDTFCKILESSFGSIEEFKTLFMNSCSAISGDGFTWLIAKRNSSNMMMESLTNSKNNLDKLFVLNTYNAGSPYINDRLEMMKMLANKANKMQEGKMEMETDDVNSEKVPIFEGMMSVEEARETHSVDVKAQYVPLLAIDGSPKSWLMDYGVFGKEQYLNHVWDSIDWYVVANRLPKSVE